MTIPKVSAERIRINIIDDIYRFPLRNSATDKINKQLRSGIADSHLADLAMALREEDRLCIVEESEQTHEPRVLCSMGLFEKAKERA